MFNSAIIKDTTVFNQIYTLNNTLDNSHKGYLLGLGKYEFNGINGFGHGGFWGTVDVYFPKLKTSIVVYVLEKDKGFLITNIMEQMVKLMNDNLLLGERQSSVDLEKEKEDVNCAIASEQRPDKFAKDKEDIIAAVKAEVKAYFDQDFETLIKYWIQTPELLYVSNTSDHYYTITGCESFNKGIKGDFKKDINPNLEVNKTNFDILTDGKYAFLQFDVINKLTSGNKIKTDSSKSYAIMVKSDKVWKFIFMHQAKNTDFDPTVISAIRSLNWAAWTLGNELKDNDTALKIFNISENLDPDYEGTHYIKARLFENMKNN